MSGRGALIISAAAAAVIVAILAARSVPSAPILIAPPDGQVARSSAAIEFKWRSGGMATRFLMGWRRASHFAVCIEEYALGDFECSYPQSSDQPPWAGAIGDFPAESGAPGTSWAESITIYTHTVDQLPQDLHNLDLMWTVAACASNIIGNSYSCSHAIPARRLRTSDINLTADSAKIKYLGGSDVVLESGFSNNGSAPSGSFDVKLEVAQLHVNNMKDPIKELSMTGLDPAVDEVFLRNGEIKTIDAFLASGGGPADFKGILVRGGFRHTQTATTTAGLGPGVFGHFETSSISVQEFEDAASGTYVGLFLVVIVDPDNLIVEPDESESDNTQHDKFVYIGDQ